MKTMLVKMVVSHTGRLIIATLCKLNHSLFVKASKERHNIDRKHQEKWKLYTHDIAQTYNILSIRIYLAQFKFKKRSQLGKTA